MTYNETLDYLYNSLPVFQHIGGGAYKPGLDNIIALNKHLGEPNRKFKSVHIAGTNGKGSVSHMTASVLMAAGLRTGLFTSPHLKDFRERIRVNGEMSPESEVINFVEKHKDFIDSLQPSFFEVTTAMAFDYFAQMNVDVAVIEVGMGGRLDSTNIIAPVACAITNIGLDHTQFLGTTLHDIAGEKAGIIKQYTPVVIGESNIDTQLVFISTAKSKEAPILFADQCYNIIDALPQQNGQLFRIKNLMDGNVFELGCDLGGIYQRKNILTALTLFDVLNGAGGISLSQETVKTGLSRVIASTGFRGRWQILSGIPLTVCDTGHNAEGIAETVQQIMMQKYDKLYMVLGFVSDKDIDKVLPLLPKKAYYIFTKAGIPRAMNENLLAEKAAVYGLHGTTCPTVVEAIKTAQSKATDNDMIFIGGSNFIVAEIP